jgi:hypothetical protein
MFLEEGEVDELERASFYFTHSHGQGTSWTAVHLKEEALRATCDTSEPQEVPTTVVTLLACRPPSTRPSSTFAPSSTTTYAAALTSPCTPSPSIFVWRCAHTARDLHKCGHSVDPFMSVEGFDAAARRLRARLAQVEPFRISLEPFGYFKHKNACTLWLRPVDEVWHLTHTHAQSTPRHAI